MEETRDFCYLQVQNNVNKTVINIEMYENIVKSILFILYRANYEEKFPFNRQKPRTHLAQFQGSLTLRHKSLLTQTPHSL